MAISNPQDLEYFLTFQDNYVAPQEEMKSGDRAEGYVN